MATKTKEINGHSVFVTELHGEDEHGTYHVVVHNNKTDKGKVHTGDRASSEKFIKETVKQ